MHDPYPEKLEIEIDREALRRYLRAKWFVAWAGLLSLFGGFFGFLFATKELDKHPFALRSVLIAAAQGVGGGATSGFALGSLLYLAFCHSTAARYANALRVRVEGPFLRIHQDAVFNTCADHRLHFRSIVDYVVVEGPLLRRFKIAELQMTTTGGGQNSTLHVPGIRNCLEARDTLSEIDRLRENG